MEHYHASSPALPPCTAHDFFEGVVAYDMHLYVVNLTKNKVITLKSLNNKLRKKSLNNKLRKFKYQPSDSRDTPCEINIQAKILSGNAVQNWTFSRLFLVIHSECNGMKNSPVWALIILLHEVVQLVCARKLSQSQIY